MPQVISSRAHAWLARASVYSAFAFVQTSRLRRASSESRPAIAPESAQISPSGKNSASSRFALAFESEPWTMFSESRVA